MVARKMQLMQCRRVQGLDMAVCGKVRTGRGSSARGWGCGGRANCGRRLQARSPSTSVLCLVKASSCSLPQGWPPGLQCAGLPETPRMPALSMTPPAPCATTSGSSSASADKCSMAALVRECGNAACWVGFKVLRSPACWLFGVPCALVKALGLTQRGEGREIVDRCRQRCDPASGAAGVSQPYRSGPQERPRPTCWSGGAVCSIILRIDRRLPDPAAARAASGHAQTMTVTKRRVTPTSCLVGECSPNLLAEAGQQGLARERGMCGV